MGVALGNNLVLFGDQMGRFFAVSKDDGVLAWVRLDAVGREQPTDTPILAPRPTDTRVHATSDDARRRFAAYWRVIYPGSSLIRRTWLAAIRKRAEASAPVAAR